MGKIGFFDETVASTEKKVEHEDTGNANEHVKHAVPSNFVVVFDVWTLSFVAFAIASILFAVGCIGYEVGQGVFESKILENHTITNEKCVDANGKEVETLHITENNK